MATTNLCRRDVAAQTCAQGYIHLIDTCDLMCRNANRDRWWRSHRGHASILPPAAHAMQLGSCVLLVALYLGRELPLKAHRCHRHSCKAYSQVHCSRVQQILQLPPWPTTRQVVPYLPVQGHTSNCNVAIRCLYDAALSPQLMLHRSCEPGTVIRSHAWTAAHLPAPLQHVPCQQLRYHFSGPCCQQHASVTTT